MVPFNVLRNLFYSDRNEQNPTSNLWSSGPYPRLPRPGMAEPDYSNEPNRAGPPVSISPPAPSAPYQPSQPPSVTPPQPAPLTPAERLTRPYDIFSLGTTTPANAVIPMRRPQSYGQQAREELGPQHRRSIGRIIGDTFLGLAGGGPFGAIAGGIAGGDWRYGNRVGQRTKELEQAGTAERQAQIDEQNRRLNEANIEEIKSRSTAIGRAPKVDTFELRNPDSGAIELFERDPATGKLKTTGYQVPNQAPAQGKPYTEQEADDYLVANGYKDKVNPRHKEEASNAFLQLKRDALGMIIDEDGYPLDPNDPKNEPRVRYLVDKELARRKVPYLLPRDQDPEYTAKKLMLMRGGQGLFPQPGGGGQGSSQRVTMPGESTQPPRNPTTDLAVPSRQTPNQQPNQQQQQTTQQGSKRMYQMYEDALAKSGPNNPYVQEMAKILGIQPGQHAPSGQAPPPYMSNHGKRPTAAPPGRFSTPAPQVPAGQPQSPPSEWGNWEQTQATPQATPQQVERPALSPPPEYNPLAISHYLPSAGEAAGALWQAIPDVRLEPPQPSPEETQNPLNIFNYIPRPRFGYFNRPNQPVRR